MSSEESFDANLGEDPPVVVDEDQSIKIEIPSMNTEASEGFMDDEEENDDTSLSMFKNHHTRSSSRSLKNLSTEQVSLIPDQEEYDRELDELQQQKLEGEAQRLHLSGATVKLSEEEDTVIKVLPQDDHEFIGLVEEVPLEKSKKKKTKGKVRKRPPSVNFDTAVDIIRIPRTNNRFFGEGEFSEELPPELDGILPEEDFVSAIQNINEILGRIPTMRTAIVFCPPTVLVSLVMLYMVLFFQNPPFFPLMLIFGFWCTCALGVLFGAGIYYLFQREYHMAVAKEDVRVFHKGVRFAIQMQDRTALYVVIEPGEDRND